MPLNGASPPPLPIVPAQLAEQGQRAYALFVDTAILAILFAFIAVAIRLIVGFDIKSIPTIYPYMIFIFIFLSILYFTWFDSYLGSGQTIGKRSAGIRTVNSQGRTVSPFRAMLRATLVVAPVVAPALLLAIFLIVQDMFNHVHVIFAVLGGIVYFVLGATAYLLFRNASGGPLLQDLISGSIVVRVPSPAGPVAIRLGRKQTLVLAAWALVCLVLTVGSVFWAGFVVGVPRPASISAAANAPPAPEASQRMNALEATLIREGVIKIVKVDLGPDQGILRPDGSRRPTFITIEGRLTDETALAQEAMRRIAATVLREHPDLYGRDMMSISVVPRVVSIDLRAPNLSNAAGESLNATGWRKLLERAPAPPSGR